jgi:chemotaxis protein methyltransferase CheR
MLLCEQLSSREDWQIELVATDLNHAALDVARLAIYAEWSFRDSPADVRRRYFTPTSNRWQLNDRIRRMVRFAQANQM